MTIRERTPQDNPALLDIWHRAVQATHAFLTEQDIAELYLPSVAVWVAEADDGSVAGFIGVHNAQVEMLFVDPERFGQRVGTRLLDHVRAKHARLTVDVNEQNPGAHAFYRRYGFRDVGRSATDSAGRPFPLIHMAY
ncbi:GNAT family N-acetyltransferase [Burkholderia ubonensis]|uniref:GNAT family N-acetyltransferase n=1 Tax=Burkholderia ubonensis TaxID=101571 RepID=UPI00358F698C